MLQVDPQDRARLIAPLFRTSAAFWLTVVGLGAVLAWGALAYGRQLTLGLAVTGMDRPAYWGIYIVNFIFLIGVSMAGTVITAVLQLTGVNWRRPITRIAEATTVFGLMIAGLQIVIDMGRPDRLLTVFIYGRLQSPLLWDMGSLTLYLLTSMFALFTSLLPDLGILRDNLPPGAASWRRRLYSALALGWRGDRGQWLRLERVSRAVAILAIPLGVSLHTVTSWILSTTLQPGWHSTILGPYFVVGAIFSGIGLLFILMTVVRALSGARFYIDDRHYRSLGWLFLTMSAVWFYFTYTEHLVVLAGQEADELPVIASKLWGPDAASFWAMVALMVLAALVLVVPAVLPRRLERAPVFRLRVAGSMAATAALAFALALVPGAQPVTAALGDTGFGRALLAAGAGLAIVAAASLLGWLKERVQARMVIASLAVVGGMWLERWNIIVPTLSYPRLIPWDRYTPSMTEWSLTAASAALFVLLLLLFFKLFPAVSLWEVAEGRVLDEVQAGVQVPMPSESSPSFWPAQTIPGSGRRSL